MPSELPPIELLPSMSALDRDILLSRVMAAVKRKKARAIEKAAGLPDIVDWIEAHCYDADKVRNAEFPIGSPKILLESFQKRILRHCFTINPKTGRFPYRTVVYSAPKKSGKSAIGGCITAYFAACVETPNAIFVLANDREQSSGRVYKAAKPTLYGLGGKKDGKFAMVLQNGSAVQASTSDPDKEAGGSYGLTVWDELWAYKTERAALLWDELRPIPTRTNSMRLVVTYAGFEDSSDLLYSIYQLIFANSKETSLHPNARPVAGLEDITTTDSEGNIIPTCYENLEAGLFYFNDHEQRMSWQKGEHGEALTREITALESKETNTFRLTFNRWQKTEDRFLYPHALKASFVWRARQEKRRKLTLGVDAGWIKDNSAIVGVDIEFDKYVTDYVACWKPEDYPKGLDLEATIMEAILTLWRENRIATRKPKPDETKIVNEEHLTCLDVWFDETQLHQMAMNLRKKHRLLIRKFDQKRPRLLADTFLRRMYNENRIINCDVVDSSGHSDLYSHLDAARAITKLDADEELYRIVKGTGINAKPIDLAVAQSMAVYACSNRPRTIKLSGIAQGVVKGWN